MRAGPRRLGTTSVWIILSLLILLLALAAPGEGPTGANAALPTDRSPSANKASSNATPASAATTAQVGVISAGLRQVARLTPATSLQTVCPSATPLHRI